MWAIPLRRRSKRPWQRRSRCRLPSAANFTSLRSSPSAGLWSGVSPGWTRTGTYGRAASDISIPVCSSSISLSWHFCLEDREHVLRALELQGIKLYFLPAYIPELNRIEKLWQQMKYVWMDVKSRTIDILNQDVSYILDNFGIDFKLAF